ncbi:MAG: peptide chain release factor N(5)-glutamine methyltransferase [Eubacterium sp.]|nr:peptide chain release factor N(5)-glutamine methyltransferase [Eubacterium sp.]
MNIYQLQKWGAEYLEQKNIVNAVFDSKELLEYVLNLDNTGLILRREETPEPSKAEEYKTLIYKRAEHYPLQYITHRAGFMGYEFYVDENVLIPRYDTEILVDRVLQDNDASPCCNILDMCTGSGCIGISIMLQRKHCGKKDNVMLVDISRGALSVAAKNMEQLGAEADLMESDLYKKLTDIYDKLDAEENDTSAGLKKKYDGFKFDIIVSNPPYIKSDVIPALMEEVKEYEPSLALDGDRDGLKFYREIIGKAPLFLKKKGRIYLEIGYDQYEDTRKLLVDAGFTNIKIYKDLAGLDRVVSAELMDV